MVSISKSWFDTKQSSGSGNGGNSLHETGIDRFVSCRVVSLSTQGRTLAERVGAPRSEPGAVLDQYAPTLLQGSFLRITRSGESFPGNHTNQNTYLGDVDLMDSEELGVGGII